MSAPPIVPRSAWGANPLECPAPSIATPTAESWAHHTGSTGLHGAAGMRSLQANAIAQGYLDVEYSYVIDNPDGTIYESRGPGRDTAATGGRNSISSAVCAMGNFETQVPSEALLNSFALLVRWMHDEGYGPATITGPHKEAPDNATACCGANLIARLDDINARAQGATSLAEPEPADVREGAMQLVRTKSGKGYWVCASDGGVFSYGDAAFYGSMGGKTLNAPVVGMAATPSGRGYALCAEDGGVFCFGDAPYLGGMAGRTLNAPLVDIEFDAEGDGYWLLAKDGGVFTFGKTGFYGAPTGKVK